MESDRAQPRRNVLDGPWGVAAMLLVLLAMFGLMVGSAWNDSATYDEVSHIGAGFAYITQGHYRINAEAPLPLKALSAWFAELAVHPDFPAETRAMRQNNSSEQGRLFLYESGNDADRIIFWARMPLMLAALVLGALLFLWTRRRFGGDTALLALLFFAFSPTMLSHARLVNSDLGASFGFFIGIVAFLRFLEAPSRGNILIAGLALGTAALCKFSVALLMPLLAILLAAWILTMPDAAQRRAALRKYLPRSVGVAIVAVLVIWGVYGYFVWGSSAPARYSDAFEFPLLPFASEHPLIGKVVVPFDLVLLKSWLTRPLGECLLGLLLATGRVADGDFAYFLGTLTAKGSRFYFPALYLLKEPLPLHLLTLMALGLAAASLLRSRQTNQPVPVRISRWIHANFAEFSALTFVIVYWTLAIRSGLNIGVRHVMPTFPFIYILVSRRIASWLRHDPEAGAGAPGERRSRAIGVILPRVAVTAVMLSLVVGTARAFPYFLPYYNILAGGTENGWKIAIDSNYDWGQDLYRLRDYVARNNIKEISLDYFGRADPQYYLGNALVQEKPADGEIAHGWFAISASNRQMAYAEPEEGFDTEWKGAYDPLKGYEPVDRVGYSIFIYRLP
jgi:hypothetical protein